MPGKLFRDNELLFGPSDDVQNRAGLNALVVGKAQFLQTPLDDRLLIAAVVHDEIAVDAVGRAVDAEKLGADGVEGADPHIPRYRAADEGLDARLHLAGSLVGKRDREDIPRRNVVLGDEVGDAVREDARLAAPGSGEYEQGAFVVQHGLALRGVQCIENRRHEKGLANGRSSV